MQINNEKGKQTFSKLGEKKKKTEKNEIDQVNSISGFTPWKWKQLLEAPVEGPPPPEKHWRFQPTLPPRCKPQRIFHSQVP